MTSHAPDQDLLSLLRSKNRCLQRLMDATQVLLLEPTENLVVFSSDGKSSDPLGLFNSARENVIRALELYDRKITALIPDISAALRTPEFLRATQAEMERNERLIVAIFGADDLVFEKIAAAQAQIAKMSTDQRRSREALNKFKSTWIAESGEEMDQTL